jgi:hypothetical protein
VKIWLQWREFTQEISSQDLSVGTHIIRVESVDMDFNIWEVQVILTVLGEWSTVVPVVPLDPTFFNQ